MTREGFSLLSAFKCAWNGIKIASHERNFRIELGFLVLCVALGIAFAIEPIEWVACFICFGLVLGGEAINTAIEAVVDLVSPEYNELAGIAKDCAAGATYLFAIGALAVGILLFLPRIAAVILPLIGITL